MPVRIYTLAKELKLDSKELVDICTKAGIPGKGSALASLADDEAEKVKAFLAGGSAKPSRSKSAPPPMPEPPKRPATVEKIPVIVAKRKAVPRPAPLAGHRKKEVAAPAPPIPPEVEEAPAEAEDVTTIIPAAPADIPADIPADAIPAEVATTAEVEPTPVSSAPSAIRREDYIGPASTLGKMPVLGDRAKPAGPNRAESGGTGPRARPTIKLAPLPTQAPRKPSAKPAKDEPAPQKPDMKLPADIVRATTSGQSRPLAAHLRTSREGRGSRKTAAAAWDGNDTG